jgi:hypothetical protein
LLLPWFVACGSDPSPGAKPGSVSGAAGQSPGGAGSGGAGSSGSGGTGGAGGSAGTAGLAGSAGSLAGSAGSSNGGTANSLPPLGPAPVDKPDTVEVGVRNNCPFSIWIHAEGKQGVLMPDKQELKKGEHYWYDAPSAWEAARITAYGDAELKEELDKAEMTFDAKDAVLNYNVTYVDWVGLPLEMISRGGGGDCKKVGCYLPEAEVLSGCPDGLLEGRRCLAARTYCLNGRNDDQPYCHALDAEVERCASTKPECAGAAGLKTANVYACDEFFGGSPKWCAAVNRAMLDDPDNKDTSAYYQTSPFNTYSQWVHQACPGIYAFAYDDYPPNAEESGFHACAQGKELEVTFCPAG